MGKFRIINHTQNTKSGYVCANQMDDILNCTIVGGSSLSVQPLDSLSLEYTNMNAPPGTKVHFVDALSNADLQVAAGTDKLNSEHWVNPWWQTAWSGGTYQIYAWDEFDRKGTVAITVTVGVTYPTECSKEGELSTTLKPCCSGLIAQRDWTGLSYCRKPCVPDWKCNTPANGTESDGCGNTRKNTNCNPSSVWSCNQPLDGWETDQHGNTRKNPSCNPQAPSVYTCEQPLNGYEHDQYGNRVKNSKCNPISSKPNTKPDQKDDLSLFIEKYGNLIIVIVIVIIILIVLLLRR